MFHVGNLEDNQNFESSNELKEPDQEKIDETLEELKTEMKYEILEENRSIEIIPKQNITKERKGCSRLCSTESCTIS